MTSARIRREAATWLERAERYQRTSSGDWTAASRAWLMAYEAGARDDVCEHLNQLSIIAGRESYAVDQASFTQQDVDRFYTSLADVDVLGQLDASLLARARSALERAAVPHSSTREHDAGDAGNSNAIAAADVDQDSSG